MSALLNPPPLLSMAILLAAAIVAFWWGLRRPAAPDGPAAGVVDERSEVWGLPDPPPPPKRPYAYAPQNEPAPPARLPIAKPTEQVREIQLADLFARSRRSPALTEAGEPPANCPPANGAPPAQGPSSEHGPTGAS